MAPTISFLAGSVQVNNLAGSGLGFYGSNFGASVPVGSFASTVFITSADGTQQGPPCHCNQWISAPSAVVDSQTSGIPLTAITNNEAVLNIRFTDSTGHQTQNAYILLYDRYSTANAPSGVTTKAAEIAHPDPVQNNNGSGSTTWTTFSGVAAATGTKMNLNPSPGTSGLHNTPTSAWTDVQHDWYLALSASPDTVGSHTQYGLQFYTEYL